MTKYTYHGAYPFSEYFQHPVIKDAFVWRRRDELKFFKAMSDDVLMVAYYTVDAGDGSKPDIYRSVINGFTGEELFFTQAVKVN